MMPKVLIVDDDPSIRLLFRKCLKRWDYEPLEAADVRDEGCWTLKISVSYENRIS